MKSLFTEHKILAGVILVLFIFSLLCQIITGFLYQNMIKETYNMSSTKNKMLKTCKLKFTNRYELHEKVVNIPVFVDKFLHGIKFGPLSAKSIEHLGGQLLLLSIFITGAGACRGIIVGETIGEILAYYLAAFVMLYAYFSISAAVDLKGKKEVLKTNLIDYLENNISVRIPQSKKEQERLDRLEAAGGEDGVRREENTGPEKEYIKRANDGREEYGKRMEDGGSDTGKGDAREKPVRAGERSTEIADFAAHKKKGEEKKLAPEEMKELEGLLLEFVYDSY